MSVSTPSTARIPTSRRLLMWLGLLGLACAVVALLLLDRGAPLGRVHSLQALAQPAPAGESRTGSARRGPSREGKRASAEALAASREDALREAAEERHLRRLLQEPDPRRRLVALYLLALKTPDLAAQRRARAAIAQLRVEAPDDPLIAQAQEWFCGDRRDPCMDVDLAAWPQVEPDNAASHLAALRRARDDAGQQDVVLRRMAQAGHYESHIHALALEGAAAFDDYNPPPLGPQERRFLRELGVGQDLAARRQVAAGNHAWAMPFPAFEGISRACRPPLPAARARDCRIVLMRMAGGTTLIERMVAFSGLERLTRGTPEGLHWANALRRQRWWSQQFATIVTGASYWQDFLRYGEIEAMRRGLLRAGRPLDPPPGWRASGT